MYKSVIQYITICWVTLLSFSCSETIEEPDFNEQLTKDLALIDAYLADNALVAEADPKNQIRYILHESGTGERPTLDSCITTNYEGRFLSSNESFDSGENFSFRMRSVIKGWQIGLPLLREGDSVSLYIPSGLAYGYFGVPINQIPSNSNIIFGVKLLHVGKNFSTTPSPEGSCN
ncbi:MAG: FKBP-type peptidyl-prolyl cis-trans isomerase [Cyclobacteriaceae bacterium]|nr:FKBP-type peptidyl-prolyl cis-trans isomerase [Cyclobacteriaceae bacterium]